jgi:hypothetical protein
MGGQEAVKPVRHYVLQQILAANNLLSLR